MKKTILVILVCVLTIIAQNGCGVEATEVSDSGFYLDTECEITVYDKGEEDAKEMIKGAFDLCEEYENKLSRTIEDSDIYKINHAGGEFVEVSDDTIEVIEMGLDACEASDGKFDITVGRLSDLWQFGSENPTVPQDAELAEAVKTVGYKDVEVSGNKVKVKDGQHIDLGAIAKGYISAKVAEYLKEEGTGSALINLGGNVVTIGTKPDGTKFKVGIRNPQKDSSEIIGSVEAKDQAVITSGIYERQFESGGKTYHHILDPKTGMPVESDAACVSLISDAEDAGMCDAYSTICLLLGTEDGKEFIEKQDGFEALFVSKDGEQTATAGMEFESE